MSSVILVFSLLFTFGCINPPGSVSNSVSNFSIPSQSQTPNSSFMFPSDLSLCNRSLLVTSSLSRVNSSTSVIGEKNLLVILWDPKRASDPAPSKTAIEQLIFGSQTSGSITNLTNETTVRNYFLFNSNGRFTIKKTTVLGWYSADKPSSYYWSPEDTNDADNDGWINGHTAKWAEAIGKADKEFDFSSYDRNRDGTLSPDELGILIVIPQNGPFGTNRVPLARQYPTAQPLVVDGVRIPKIAEVYAGNPLNLGIFAHELSHLYANLPDLYFPFFYPYAPGSYSLMDSSYSNSLIDPYNRFRSGWIEPKLINKDGCYSIATGEFFIIDKHNSDPASAFFLLENRERNATPFDSSIQDDGIAIWQIIEDPTAYGNLSAPAGVDPPSWQNIPATEWGRRSIRMIRPSYYPFDDSKALWKNLSDKTQLNWSDGQKAFLITNISNSGPIMRFVIQK
ncbi:hypothetical protein HZC07_00875 [Candidatus Micrarchaeota archaeon]|nr:hypothetical protein [Candidatus Micrarchaeota archaeon]